MEQMKLDDILSGVERPTLTQEPKAEAPAPETKAEAPAAEAPKAEAPQSNVSTRNKHRDKEQAAHGRERDATGKFVEKAPAEAPKAEPKIEAKAEPKAEPKEEFTPKEKAFLRAAEEERRKRQELEKRLNEMTRVAPQQQPAQPQQEAKTFWDDPEGHLQRFQHQMQQGLVVNKLNTSEAIARSRHPDFQEKVDIFAQLVKTTPGLFEQMSNAPDPAEYAYTIGNNHKRLADAGNIDKLAERIERETRVKVEAEIREKMKKEDEARKATVAALPGSLSNVTGVSSNSSRPSWSGPTPLDSILKS